MDCFWNCKEWEGTKTEKNFGTIFFLFKFSNFWKFGNRFWYQLQQLFLINYQYFRSYVTLEVRNSRVTKPSRAKWRHTSSYKLLFFYFRVINSKLKNKKFHFELLTWRLKFYFFYLRVTNSKLKNKKLHFELLNRWLNFYFFTFELLTRG